MKATTNNTQTNEVTSKRPGLWSLIAGAFLLVAAGLTLALAPASSAQTERILTREKTDANQPKPATSDNTAATAERPELILQTGHDKNVDGLAFSPDGRLLATASSDGTIKLWDVNLGRELRTLTGHTGAVRAVVFSSNGQWLASGGIDGKVKLWDVVSGREMNTLARHSASVNALVFSPDGRLLATGSADNTIRLWEVAAKSAPRVLSGHTSWVLTLAFSPDGQILASGGADNTIQLWDVAKARELKTLTEHTGWVKSVVFSPDGRRLASGGFDRTVRLWEMPKGKALRPLPRHSGNVLAVAFSPDGERLITGSADRAVRQFEIAAAQKEKGKEDHANSAKQTAYETIAFSPDGKWQAASIGDGTVELRQLTAGGEVRTLESHANSINAVAFSRDGRWLASGHKDDTVKLWDLKAGYQVSTLAGGTGRINALAFGPVTAEGQWLAAGSQSGAIKLWNVATGGAARSLVGHSGSVNALAFSRDGKGLFSGGADKTVKVWDPTAGRERTFARLSDDIRAISLDDDGRRLAVGGADKKVSIWDVTTGNKVRTLERHREAVHATALSADGRWVASGSADKTVKLWDATTGKELHTLTHTGWVYSVAFSPDSHWLAAGSLSGTVKIWSVDTGGERANLTGHSGSVNSVCFNSDGRWLASGSDDGSTRLWNATAGELAATLVSLRESTDWLTVGPNGLFDGSPTAWGQILWRFARNTYNVAPVEAFFNEFYNPGLLAKILEEKEEIKVAPEIAQRDRRQPQVRLALAGGAGGQDVPVATRTVTVKLEVMEAPPDKDGQTGSGAQDVRLFRNGALVKVWRGDVLKGRAGSALLEATLPIIAGENRLTAYAFNRDNVKSSDVTLTLKGAETIKRPGKLYLLAIGVNQYANEDFVLKYALADTKLFSEELKSQQARLSEFADIEIIHLFDQQATKANILLALKRLSGSDSGSLLASAPAVLAKIKPVQPEDGVIVYFSGHGVAYENQFYLVPHDLGYKGTRDKLTKSNVQPVLAHSVSDRELEQAFEGIDAGHVILVIDACNSGQALQGAEKLGPMNSKGLAQLAYEKGLYVLTAAQSYQIAWEDAKLGHGYLTYVLVKEGIEDKAADRRPQNGEITVREWFDYAIERVPQVHHERSKDGRIIIRENPSSASLKAGELDDQVELQRPRTFYRREAETKPLIIASPGKAEQRRQ